MLKALKRAIRNKIYKNKFQIIGKGNRIDDRGANIKNTTFNIKGENNVVILEDKCCLRNCQISIFGDHNVVQIGSDSFIKDTEFYLEESGNTIEIGNKTFIYGKTQLCAIEGTRILIGEESMFSSDIHFRTGDSHSIINQDGNRINQSKDIMIGKHVWIGTKVICLKGTEVSDNCVVGAGSLLSGKYLQSNCILAGVPARVLKEDINWIKERLK